ncbi:MAG: two-component system OmpR family copper resistance phosphate regulon response regulator CusR [Rhodocyclaceae bacterium]|nr:MAG: two-component system OmpR family copper resistance phosphate regulon response regulator CusR [Rhodocyclaceae bacterium]
MTALGKVEDRVNGLQTGADDYLVKPFAFSELIARIQGLLRRSVPQQPEATSNRLALHDLEMDLARRKVSRNGQRVDLSAKEFLLLSLFLRKQGEVLSRTEIAEVEVSIKRLRAKMDTPFETQLLHTVRGMGYVLELRE